MNDHDWEDKSKLPQVPWSKLVTVLVSFHSNRTKQIMNQDVLQIRWWQHQETVTAKQDSFCRRPRGSLMTSLALGNLRVCVYISKRFT